MRNLRLHLNLSSNSVPDEAALTLNLKLKLNVNWATEAAGVAVELAKQSGGDEPSFFFCLTLEEVARRKDAEVQ